MPHRINRRQFLKLSSLSAAAATFGFPAILPAQASKRVNVACIGVGGRGGSDLRENVAAGGNVVALCDVDPGHLAAAAKRHPDARAFTDYRKMLEKVAREIDAVVVATPDHHHFPASMMAIHLGKHVYCEKPLTHSIWEARQITVAAKKAGVATQMGTQGHSSEGIRLLVEWIQAGVIGDVKEVHIWTDRPAGWWPQGIDRPEGEDPIPPGLDWDLWIGPAPMRPYKKNTYHSFRWRGWWDFGTCALGDIGCHALDWSWWALNLTAPTSVEATQMGMKQESGPLWSNITYQFPASGTRPPVKLCWYDGRNKQTRKDSPAWEAMAKLHELAELGDRDMPENGKLFIGEKGKILLAGEAPRLTPESKMADFKRPEKTLSREAVKLTHHGDWLEACRGTRPAGSNFAYAGPLAEAVLLGNIALRTGKKIDWDSENLRVTNVIEANALVKPDCRKGWEVV